MSSNVLSYPANQERFGERLTAEELKQGIEHTWKLADQADRAGEIEDAQWLEEIADKTRHEYPGLYEEAYGAPKQFIVSTGVGCLLSDTLLGVNNNTWEA